MLNKCCLNGPVRTGYYGALIPRYHGKQFYKQNLDLAGTSIQKTKEYHSYNFFEGIPFQEKSVDQVYSSSLFMPARPKLLTTKPRPIMTIAHNHS